MLEVRLRVAASGLDVGVPEDVGDQDQVVGVIAHESGGDGVAQRVRGLLDARSAITAVTILLIERTDSCSPVAGATPLRRQRGRLAVRAARPVPGD